MGLELKYEDGQTPLDEDEKEGILIETITTQQELNEFEQLNIEKAMIWVLESKLKKDKILTEKFIKDLHKRMYSEVWKWAGEFRKSNKNIGIEWTQIGIQLKALMDDTIFWIDNQIYTPEEIAIRFKHRIVAIHCFPNGNGRHSRLMADIIIEKIFGESVFGWHRSNMVKADDTRKKYIQCLREADNGNINPLVEFAKT